MDFSPLLKLAIEAAEKACQEILTIYHSDDFQVEVKSDQSPLTLADRKAHDIIVATLSPSGLPLLSEEGKETPYAIRKNWDYFWLIDPLDGTKEFLKRNGEFTVNIALIHQQRPVLGVVAVPVTGLLYYGLKGAGAFMKDTTQEAPLTRRGSADLSKPGLRVVASRSHLSPETEEFIKRLKEPALVSAGSSLKFMLLATNQADVYPRLAPTMEWDTAASHIIVNEVGFKVCRPDTKEELVYNKESLLNPSFVVF